MDPTSKRATKSVSTERAATTHAASTASSSAADFLPDHRTVESLRQAEQTCHGCELYLRATQAVGGEGPSSAEMVLVGDPLSVGSGRLPRVAPTASESRRGVCPT